MHAVTTESGGWGRALPISGSPRWSGPALVRDGGRRAGLAPGVEDRAEAGSDGLRQTGPRARLLLAEGDERIRWALARLLEGEGYQVDLIDPESVSGVIGREQHDAALIDVDVPGLDWTEIPAAHAARLIALTAFPNGGEAASVRNLGAFEVLAKPLATDDLLQVVARAVQAGPSGQRPSSAGRWAEVEVGRRIVGETPVMERLFAAVARVAPLPTTVLITGETGTGKELVARAIHDLSPRAGKPFVPVHCAALPETLLESELFGHVRGSFTGALSTRQGLLEEANGGTLFLDEVSTLSLATQVKLLRVLQERTVQRIGSNKPIPLDFRLVAASNADLAAEVRAGRFREDLYYRLQVFPIHVPPLRERRADIPLLAEHFRRRFAEANGVTPPAITSDTAHRMMEHDWPGNVRELENTVERMLVTHLGASSARFEAPTREAEPAVELAERGRREGWDLARLEREYILATIEHLGGRRGEAADRLGIDRRTLGRKLRAYRIALTLAAAGGSAAPVVAQRRRKPRGQRRTAGITSATWAA